MVHPLKFPSCSSSPCFISSSAFSFTSWAPISFCSSALQLEAQPPPNSTSFCFHRRRHDDSQLFPPSSYRDPSALETEEESKFVPLNADDPVYGPPALLLLGFEVEEAAQIRQLLKELDGEFLQIIFCTDDMIQRSLWEAMHTKQSNLETMKIAKALPRICFLSGLSGEETIMFIDAFAESGLESPVFAALVPNSADKPLQELIEEIMGDHEMMTGQNTKSA